MTSHQTKSTKGKNINMLTVRETDTRMSELQRDGWPGSYSIHFSSSSFQRHKPKSVRN